MRVSHGIPIRVYIQLIVDLKYSHSMALYGVPVYIYIWKRPLKVDPKWFFFYEKVCLGQSGCK